MPKLYMPLRVLQQMKVTAKNENIALQGEGNNPMVQILGHVMGKESQTLNLDNFLSWAIGSTFLKSSYGGTYKEFNSRILDAYRAREGKGLTYKKARKKCRDTVLFGTIFACWEQHKQAYRFDADFIKELMATGAVKIPVEILLRLPFRCFYLDLEDAGIFHGIAGVFVYIGFDEITGLPNIATIRVKEQEGKEEVLMGISYASGPDMEKWNMLVNDGNENPYIQFTNDVRLPQETDEVFGIYLFILQAMLYLCSSKPDTMESPKKKYIYLGKKKEGKTEEPDISLADVGIRYGTAIRVAKKQQAKESTEPEIIIVKNKDRKRKMASHMRSAHWHHYWVGKGRKELIVKWIPPVFVSGTGKELPVTIHNVERGG